MTDRDHSLQDAFDRHRRGEAPPPDTEGDPEAAAYQLVYSALEEEPDGDLPNDFAVRVANQVGLTTDPVVSVAELLLLLAALAGFGAAAVASPSVFGTLLEGMEALLRTVQRVSSSFRLDILLATSFVLGLTLLVDWFLRHWRPVRRSFST